MKKILFFLKADAGKGLTEDVETGIREKSKEYRYHYRIFHIPEKPDTEKIRQALENFKPSVAVAAGGDGTVNLIARNISDSDISLGIIPLGSSNALAYQLGIPENAEDAIGLIARGKGKKTDALIINGSYLCMHMCDLGMNARIIKRREDENQGGFFGYVKQYFRELGYKHNFRYTIKTEDKQISSKAVMIVMANSPYYGTGASIAPEGRPDDGWFELVIVKAYAFWFLFYMLITIFFKNYRNKTFRTVIKTRKAHITVSPPQEMQIDGEPLGIKEKVQAEIRSAYITIICNE